VLEPRRRDDGSKGSNPHVWLTAALLFTGARLLPFFAFGGFPILDDLRAQDYPWYAALFSQIRAGRWPAWSPEIFLGYPLSASVETHLFSPFSLPFLFFDLRLAFGISRLLACLVATATAFFLARRLGASPHAAFVSGILWGAGNHVLYHQPYTQITFAWFPLVWLFWERVLDAEQPHRSAIACGLVGGLALLGGNLQHTYTFGLFLFLYTLANARPLSTARRSRFHWVGGGALSVAIAGGIFAVNLLPSLEIVATSVRHHMTPLMRTQGGSRVADLPAVLFPGWRGGAPEYLSLGALSLIVAVWACGRNRRLENSLLCLTVVFFLLTMGSEFPPGGALVRQLPGYDFREPVRIGLVCILTLSILVGRGLDAVCSLALDRTPTGNLIIRFIAVLVLCGAAVAVLGLPPTFGREDVLLVLLCPALVLAWRASPLMARPLGMAVPTLLIAGGVTLFSLGGWSNMRMEAFRDETPDRLLQGLLDLPKTDSLGPVRIVVLPRLAKHGSNYVLLSGHQSPGGYASLTPYRPTRLFSIGRDVEPFSYERRADFEFVGYPNLLDLLNVRYLIASDASTLTKLATAAGAPAPRIETRHGVSISERLSYLPRSFFINRAAFCDTEASAFRAVTSPTFDPRKELILEPGEGPGVGGRGSLGRDAAFLPAPIASYSPARVIVDVDAPEPGWLVLLDRYAAGWSCRVNGAPAPIEQADYLFRAVKVPAGRIHAVFVYEDRMLRAGALISAGTMLLSIGTLLMPALGRTRRQPGEVS
jgi:hypothetical protein